MDTSLKKENSQSVRRDADSALAESERIIMKSALIPQRRVVWWKVSVGAVFIAGGAAAFAFMNSTITGNEYIPQPSAVAAPAELADLSLLIPPNVQGELEVGQEVVFNTEVANAGAADAGAFKTIFEIDYNASVFEEPDKALFGTEVATLEKNTATQAVSAPVTITQSGTHTIRACVDVFGEVVELNEDNNCGPALIFSVQNSLNSLNGR